MGYGATGTTGQTGVGSNTTTTGQSAQPGFGGKGGGTSTTPQSLPQANQTSSTQQAPQPVFGGNAFGYNMQRLASRMDPSATLPEAPQASSAQQQQQPAAGGKGGGYGELPGIQDFMGQFDQQQPQQFNNPFAYQQQQQPYGITGVQQPSYNPYDYYGQQQTSQQQFAQQENPYAGQMKQYEDQMASMRSNYDSQLADMKRQMEQYQDTGEKLTALPESYDKLTGGYTTQEEVAADKAETQAEADATAAQQATLPAWQQDKSYAYKTYANFKPEDLVGMSKSEITSLYGTQTTQAKADVTKAEADYKAALKTGDPKLIAGARDNLNAQKAELTSITNDQKAAKKLVTGGTGKNKTYQIAAPAGATATASPITTAKTTTAKATPAAKATTKKKAKAATTKATTKKKAKGGVVHQGMSNRLKHMLGE